MYVRTYVHSTGIKVKKLASMGSKYILDPVTSSLLLQRKRQGKQASSQTSSQVTLQVGKSNPSSRLISYIHMYLRCVCGFQKWSPASTASRSVLVLQAKREGGSIALHSN